MIPPFATNGVLPPFLGLDPTDMSGRSPYSSTIEEVVQRFSTSAKRREILDGFLRFRKALRDGGMANGIQWLDGSFLESRPVEPGDIDVITFVAMPDADATQFATDHPQLLDPVQTKATYSVDAYFVALTQHPWDTVWQTAYWYGLFSHQRGTRNWKGMLRSILPPPTTIQLHETC